MTYQRHAQTALQYHHNNTILRRAWLRQGLRRGQFRIAPSKLLPALAATCHQTAHLAEVVLHHRMSDTLATCIMENAECHAQRNAAVMHRTDHCVYTASSEPGNML
jgi:hypothetical protein